MSNPCNPLRVIPKILPHFSSLLLALVPTVEVGGHPTSVFPVWWCQSKWSKIYQKDPKKQCNYFNYFEWSPVWFYLIFFAACCLTFFLAFFPGFYPTLFLAFYLTSIPTYFLAFCCTNYFWHYFCILSGIYCDILSAFFLAFGPRRAPQHPELPIPIWCLALTLRCRKKTGVMAASEGRKQEGRTEGRSWTRIKI